MPPAIVSPTSLMRRPGGVRGGRGYLLQDNRASGGTLEEYATLTCAHCGVIVVLNTARTRPRGYCAKCHAYICDDKACSTYCAPVDLCLDLAKKYPGLPTLPRGPHGELLFDPSLLEEGKSY